MDALQTGCVHIKLYDADVSLALISKVTDAVMELVVEWQNRLLENRLLDAVYPIVYLDCIVLKVRQDSRVINKSVFLALSINIEGQKELLGMWLAENEGAKFWLNVLTELKNCSGSQNQDTGIPVSTFLHVSKAVNHRCSCEVDKRCNNH